MILFDSVCFPTDIIRVFARTLSTPSSRNRPDRICATQIKKEPHSWRGKGDAGRGKARLPSSKFTTKYAIINLWKAKEQDPSQPVITPSEKAPHPARPDSPPASAHQRHFAGTIKWGVIVICLTFKASGISSSGKSSDSTPPKESAILGLTPDSNPIRCRSKPSKSASSQFNFTAASKFPCRISPSNLPR